MDGFTRTLLQGMFDDPERSPEDKRALADSISQAYGADPNNPPTPEQAKAVRDWCPMGD